MNSLVLMENAAIGCAQWLQRRLDLPDRSPSAVILCGRGNNGGDGLAIARHLLLAGWRCQVIQLGPIEKLSADALCNWKVLTAQSGRHCVVLDDVSVAEQLEELGERLKSVDVIVDALLGSGAQGAPRRPMSDLIQLANSAKAYAWRSIFPAARCYYRPARFAYVSR